MSETNKPTVPFNPRSFSTQRERLPEALEEIHDIEDIAEDPSARPGANERHVFDFYSGLRLIISIDRDELIGTVLHLSVSVSRSHWDPRQDGNKVLAQTIKELGLPLGDPDETLESEGGVYHLFYDLERLDRELRPAGA